MIVRSITHWTGGPGRATALDRKHYHRIVEFDGTLVDGAQAIEDNITTADGDYAAHTLRLNTGSAGFAMAGMGGAVEDPFDPGPFAIQERQFEAHCALLARWHLEQGIPVTPRSCLTHAEVEGTYGVRQRGKWDLTRLVFKPELRGARAVGDYLRERVLHYQGAQPRPRETNRPILRKGGRGAFVTDLQDQLFELGFFAGKVDGIFGVRTEAAVLAFQASAGLATDGVVGSMTWRALTATQPMPERDVEERDLRADGSRTIAEADKAEAEIAKAEVWLGGTAGLSAVAYIAESVDGLEGRLATVEGLAGRLQAFAVTYWPLILIAAAVAIAFNSTRVVKAAQRTIRAVRTEDARTGRNLGR